ncbi:dNTP triphosphohydrolase [Brevibacterium sp. BDJS002]|uniref:deoxyguanosinetriphosphate triphosphohydrolase family protein n=1 Tax=Brevibacterium sp. BDJS002 TaxID=3020906 RepID=UPI0023077E12|nr:dNTP triphosphohydrolase [Brevibacterium sp. BDJS002]WCE41184.1 dNTP triphosphohydrolase [Brevibacterium sp. BDJS002]
MNPDDRRHTSIKGDNRSPYQRDRDRIIYSSLYRRLAGVTQVVSALEGHVFHNRLTHTLKVAQIARRLSEHLKDQHQVGNQVLDPDVAEAAAHAHDLGHPPFGHIGEIKLQSLMRKYCGHDHFEGNAQSFRAVTKLARNSTGYKGLDLTRRTLDAILKYPWQIDGEARNKWGAYAADSVDFQFARAAHDDSEQSLEAEIMDWADDITYAVHDTEDLIRAGLVSPNHLRTDTSYRQEFASWVHQRWLKRRQSTADPVASEADISNALDQITALLPFSRSYTDSTDDEGRLRKYSSHLISTYLRHNSQLEQNDNGVWRLHVDSQARLEVDILKELTWRYLIEGPSLAAQQHGQITVIENVFTIMFDAADENLQTNSNILPIRAAESLESAKQLGEDSPSMRARIVADAICAMTEDEILRFNARLTGSSLGSVLDAIV